MYIVILLEKVLKLTICLKSENPKPLETKAKKAKQLAKQLIGDTRTPLTKGIAEMDSLGRSTAAYIQSWQDRNRSNNGTKLNP